MMTEDGTIQSYDMLVCRFLMRLDDAIHMNGTPFVLAASAVSSVRGLGRTGQGQGGLAAEAPRLRQVHRTVCRTKVKRTSTHAWLNLPVLCWVFRVALLYDFYCMRVTWCSYLSSSLTFFLV